MVMLAVMLTIGPSWWQLMLMLIHGRGRGGRGGLIVGGLSGGRSPRQSPSPGSRAGVLGVQAVGKVMPGIVPPVIVYFYSPPPVLSELLSVIVIATLLQ